MTLNHGFSGYVVGQVVLPLLRRRAPVPPALGIGPVRKPSTVTSSRNFCTVRRVRYAAARGRGAGTG